MVLDFLAVLVESTRRLYQGDTLLVILPDRRQASRSGVVHMEISIISTVLNISRSRISDYALHIVFSKLVQSWWYVSAGSAIVDMLEELPQVARYAGLSCTAHGDQCHRSYRNLGDIPKSAKVNSEHLIPND